MAFLAKSFQILRESIRGFSKDKCYLHASALTFYTLLSIVPMLAVAFGLAKGFGLERNLEEELHKRFSEQIEIVDLVVDFARSMLHQAEGSYIAGIGVLFLFLFVISLFGTIEGSMNVIWKVKRSRSFPRIITDYLAMMVIFPFFFIIASSLTVFLTTQIHSAMEHHVMLKKMSPFLFFSYRIAILLLIWILLTAFYIIMPNTRVRAKYAIFASVIAGSLYYLVLLAVINFQIGVSQYSAVYGSFAALPLFLFWLQISWIIVLFGAEIAYHAEHLYPVLTSSGHDVEVSLQQFTILLVDKIVKSFESGERSWTLQRLSKYFGIPESTVQAALAPLIEVGLITETRSDKHEISYQPGRDISSLTIHSIVHSSNPALLQKISINSREEISGVFQQLSAYDRDSISLKTNIPINQL